MDNLRTIIHSVILYHVGGVYESNERLLVFFLAFLLGALSFQQKIFTAKPQDKTLYIIASSITWIPVTLHIGARLYPIFFPKVFVITPLYRLFYWPSFYLALLCMVYLMIASFWRYLNKTGSIWRELNRNSYGVYIIHVILIGVFGTRLLNFYLPTLVKYPLLILLTYGVATCSSRFIAPWFKP